MTQQDIIRMAREVWGVDDWKPTQVQRLERFASLVASAEREAFIELIALHVRLRNGHDSVENRRADKLVETIRARGKA